MDLQALMIKQALARPDVRRVLEWAGAFVEGYYSPSGDVVSRKDLTPVDLQALQLLRQAGVLSAPCKG